MKVESTSYGKRVLHSFIGMLFGVLLFIGSFVVLFINEGRENLSKYVKDATQYNSTSNYTTDELVYIIGSLNATTYASDNYLNNGNYILIERSVEMYGYVEHEHSSTKENVGGSTTTVKTYSYDLDWIKTPKLKSSFQGDQSEIPNNIPSEYDTWIANLPENKTNKATDLSIDGISVSSSGLILSDPKTITLTTQMINSANLSTNESVSEGVIYRKNSQTGTISQPGVGDVRITYKAILNTDKGILFGSIENKTFVSFRTKDDNQIYRYLNDVISHSQALSIYKAEYKASLWLFRIVGFFMMFIGLLLFSRPLTTLISVIPIFARIGRFAFGGLAFVISLVLTGSTILIGMVFNNIYLAALVVIIIILIIIYRLKMKKNREMKCTKGKK